MEVRKINMQLILKGGNLTPCLLLLQVAQSTQFFFNLFVSAALQQCLACRSQGVLGEWKAGHDLLPQSP